VLNQVR